MTSTTQFERRAEPDSECALCRKRIAGIALVVLDEADNEREYCSESHLVAWNESRAELADQHRHEGI